ncbi:MAG TPA: DUF3426 domain-containing protein [Gammaproteobacteria bacterium]|nr:DUF3426 domain-containing protein [Gammaproteobacteria bacterium]
MEIRCPNCDTRFRVDPEKLSAEGTRVRCSVCSYRFLAFPDGSGKAPPEDEEPRPAEMEPAAPGPVTGGEPEAAPSRPRGKSAQPGRRGRAAGGSSLLLKLLVLFLLLGLLAEVGYAFRSHWLAWPWARSAAQQALDVTGLDVRLPIALRYYRVEAVNAHLVTLESGRRVTLVEGVLINQAPFGQRPPKLEVRALGAKGEVRYRRIKRPGKRLDLNPPLDLDALRDRWRQSRDAFPGRLAGGQHAPFVIVLEDVPPGIRRFRVEMVP